MSRPTSSLFALILITVAAALAWPTPARAQAPTAPEEEARVRLIREAQAAHAAGNHRNALEAAEKAGAIRTTPSLRYFLAFEQEELGLLAESFGNAQRCIRELELDRQNPDHQTFAQLCEALRKQLEPRVAYLTVRVPDAPPNLALRVNGAGFNQALLGVAVVISPGTTILEATAPGRLPFRSEVTTVPGGRHEVTAALLPAPVVSCPVGTSLRDFRCVPDSLLDAARDKGEASASGRAASRRWGFRLTVGGAALLAASAATWLASDLKFRSLRDDCSAGACTTDEAISGRDTVRLLDRISIGGAIASGVLLAAGSMFYIVAARQNEVAGTNAMRLAFDLVGVNLTAALGREARTGTTAFMLQSPVGRFQ